MTQATMIRYNKAINMVRMFRERTGKFLINSEKMHIFKCHGLILTLKKKVALFPQAISDKVSYEKCLTVAK